MSNVVYLPKVDLAKAPAPAGDRGRKPAPRFLERVLERVRVGLRRALAYADLLGRQQREIAALQARVERLERICERALPGQDGA